jgi:dipeptidyl aminopeptidase/acylaminoacyl peptidase
LALALACAQAGPPDPVTSDPALPDPEYPAALLGTPLRSRGALMNGIAYLAAGAGPHPTVILLHGYPGEERNLDLAQAIRRSGWNVLFFHYRGAWGSEGSFSFGGALEDVGAAVALVSSPEFAASHRADPERVALVGHSMGGFLALTAGAELAAVDCVTSLAGANLGLMRAPDPAAAHSAAARLDAMSGPIAGTTGAQLVAEIAAGGERFDTRRRAATLARKPVLLVAGARDRVTPPELHHEPLVAALREAGAAQLRALTLDADHAFSPARIALARAVVGWLADACR